MTMAGIFYYIRRMLETLLPPRYRREEALVVEAVVSGITQTCIAAILIAAWYIEFAERNSGRLGERSEMIFDQIGGGAVYASGIFVMAEFAMHPLSIAILYFICEGVVRMLAAVTSQQVIGTLPLYVVSGIHGL